MEQIGFVETEVGPLLLVDVAWARSWRGIERIDYERAWNFFDTHPHAEGGAIAVGPSNAVICKMRGAGVADVYRVSSNGILIVRAWLSPSAGIEDRNALAEKAPGDPMDLG